MTVLAMISAVMAGLTGTLMTRASRGFTRWRPATAAVVAFTVATIVMAYLVQRLPVGVVYAVWAGAAAIVLVAIDRVFFAVSVGRTQVLGTAFTLVGISLLAAGVGG